jgi:hypothetical protein
MDLLGSELTNLERLVREYVSVTKCSCPPPGQNGLTASNCWRCVFQYNLNYVDAAKLPNAEASNGVGEKL